MEAPPKPEPHSPSPPGPKGGKPERGARKASRGAGEREKEGKHKSRGEPQGISPDSRPPQDPTQTQSPPFQIVRGPWIPYRGPGHS